MKRIYTTAALHKLKEGTIIIQKYHKFSQDKSKFDINIKRGYYIILVEQIGGAKLQKKSKTYIDGIKIDCFKQLYVADAWIQKLY